MQHSPLISKIRCHHPNKKKAKVCNKNYLEYIGTREGVDLTTVDEEETEVYRESENDAYAEYIAKRPGSHGLFGNIDITDIKKVSNYVADLTKGGRNIYRGIVSLSEADAIALGYDEKQPWIDYMRSVLPDVAKEFDIPVTKLEWVAAVHMEKGHPHCHYMLWNKEDQIHSSFIHTSKQTRIREKLSGIMFQNERKIHVTEKTKKRNQITFLGKEFIEKEFSSETVIGRIQNEHLLRFGKELLSLSEKLPASGRFDYQLMPSAVKEKLKEMVDIALEIPALKKEYTAYMSHTENISRTYSPSKKHNAVTLAKADQDIRKRLANTILKSSKSILKNDELLRKYADAINDSNFDTTVSENFNHFYNIELEDKNEVQYELHEENSVQDQLERKDINCFYAYTREYKAAAKYIYNSKSEITIDNLKKAVNILKEESNKNNIVAQLELGKIFEGNNELKQIETSELYYQKAHQGLEFLLEGKCFNLENDSFGWKENKKKEAFATYEYKLGRLYENGKGTEQDYEKAKKLYERSSAAGNKYAAYSLGNMYLRGKIEEITPENQEHIVKKALEYFKQSADNDFGFAAYSYASNSEKYSFINITKEEADEYYKKALVDFIKMEEKRPDATLQYRLGSMYMKGKGTEVNFDQAEKYFIKSANRGNVYAAYSLGNLYCREKSNSCTIDEKKRYINEAAKYYKMAADLDFPFSAYSYANLCETEKLATPEGEIQAYYKKALELFLKTVKEEPEANLFYKIGCMYCDGKGSIPDIKTGIDYLKKSEELGHDAASYRLGKIYADPEGMYYNLNTAIQYFSKAAEQGNVYAKVKLGCIYLFDNDYKNIELGTQYLQEAIEEGNEIAENILKHYQESRANGLYSLSYQCINSLFQNLQSGRTTRETFSDLRRFRSKSKEQKKIDAKKQRGRTDVLPE